MSRLNGVHCTKSRAIRTRSARFKNALPQLQAQENELQRAKQNQQVNGAVFIALALIEPVNAEQIQATFVTVLCEVQCPRRSHGRLSSAIDAVKKAIMPI